jgi:hypothetical protein
MRHPPGGDQQPGDVVIEQRGAVDDPARQQHDGGDRVSHPGTKDLGRKQQGLNRGDAHAAHSAASRMYTPEDPG